MRVSFEGLFLDDSSRIGQQTLVDSLIGEIDGAGLSTELAPIVETLKEI